MMMLIKFIVLAVLFIVAYKFTKRKLHQKRIRKDLKRKVAGIKRASQAERKYKEAYPEVEDKPVYSIEYIDMAEVWKQKQKTS